jgi:hypothetical protein
MYPTPVQLRVISGETRNEFYGPARPFNGRLPLPLELAFPSPSKGSIGQGRRTD